MASLRRGLLGLCALASSNVNRIGIGKLAGVKGTLRKWKAESNLHISGVPTRTIEPITRRAKAKRLRKNKKTCTLHSVSECVCQPRRTDDEGIV